MGASRFVVITLVSILLLASPIPVHGGVQNEYYGRASISAEQAKVILGEGAVGTSTIYINNTSAKISVVAGRNWWNTSWQYRKQVNITENSGNELTNYATSFAINTQELIANNKMDGDCSDIRFIGSSYIYELPVTVNNSQNPNDLINYQAKINITDQSILNHISTDGGDIRIFSTPQSDPYSVKNEIPLWVESKTTNELILWIKANLSRLSTETVYMYYGNQSATSVSNGTQVFEYYDGFSTDTMSDYTVVDLGVNDAPSSWSVADGKMKETSNIHTHGAPDMNGTFAYLAAGDWSNYIYEAKIKTTDNDFMGLIFRYTNSSNYYRFAWEKQDHTGSGSVGPGRYLHEMVNGTWNTIDSDNVAYTTDQWYDFKIIVNGNHIEAYIDDRLVLSGGGSGPPGGSIGMYNWACTTAYWDDLRIRKLTSPQPSCSVGVENQIKSKEIELSYWIQAGCNTTSTKIWVKIPSIPSDDQVPAYMYYGNSGASSHSDGKSTFYRYFNFSSGADGIDGGVDGQDGQGGLPTNFEALHDGRTLHMWGNVWKYTTLSTTVDGDASQILECTMSSTDNGELQGIGISNTVSGADSQHTYKFTGSQSWGLIPEQTYSGSAGDWQLVYATLDDFSGTYSYVIWMGDDDGDGSQNCSLKDVRVRPYSSPEPSVTMGSEQALRYDHVLTINNTIAESWQIRLKKYSDSNIKRLNNCTIYFHSSTDETLSQIVIQDGSYTNQTGPRYHLGNSETIYMAMTVEANSTGTSYVYTYLEIQIPDTTTYTQSVITFEIT